MSDEFPFQVVEVLNGVLSVVLLWMLFFIVVHLHHSWRVLATHWGGWKAVLKMYHTNKPEIALATMIGAFFLRTLVLWYTRWTRNHGVKGMLVVDEWDSQVLIVLTVIMIVGIACWIRVISPYKGFWAGVLWVVMIWTSLAFGVGMRIFF